MGALTDDNSRAFVHINSTKLQHPNTHVRVIEDEKRVSAETAKRGSDESTEQVPQPQSNETSGIPGLRGNRGRDPLQVRFQ